MHQLPERELTAIELGEGARENLLLGIGERKGVCTQLHRKAQQDGEQRGKAHKPRRGRNDLRKMEASRGASHRHQRGQERNIGRDAESCLTRRAHLAVDRARSVAGQNHAERRQFEQPHQEHQVPDKTRFAGEHRQQGQRPEQGADGEQRQAGQQPVLRRHARHRLLGQQFDNIVEGL